MIQIKQEIDVINDPALRKRIIEEINGPENIRRKNEAYRRHLCYKDRTSHFVIQELLKQFDDDTVREMNYSLSNISIGRKIIDKLARVYSNGVQRKVTLPGQEDEEELTQSTKPPADDPEVDQEDGEEEGGEDGDESDPEMEQEEAPAIEQVDPAQDKAQNAIDEMAKLVEMNKVMKRTNRYLRAHHNTIVGVLPCPYYENNAVSYELKVQAFQPHLYDVIENCYDREKPMFVILSNYKPQQPQRASLDAAKEGRGYSNVQASPVSDGKDQAIADKKEDEDQDQYIWWSKFYHFTTNGKGEILDIGGQGKVDVINPIQDMPFVNFAMDQEGSFWAEGGDDIFDGAVKVNCMITNMDHIGVTQGYGQFYMKGKNLPRFVKAGVNKSILLEVESKDDPDPQIGFASSSPKLQELKDQVVMYVALLLTTNNLSTRSVSTELSGGQDFASGISLIIDKAESIEDVQDQRDVFQKNEPEIFKKLQKWQAVYKGALKEEYRKHLIPQEFELNLKFNDARPIMSETEKLNALKLRKELGLNTMIELLMMDDPALTEKQAEERLKKILEEKIKNQLRFMTPGANGNPNDPNAEKDQEEDPNADDVDKEEEESDDEGGQDNGQLQQDDQ